MKRVRLFSRPNSRYRNIGTPLIDNHKGVIEIWESASIINPAIWLNISAFDWLANKQRNISAHLNIKQAKELIRRLQTWVEINDK